MVELQWLTLCCNFLEAIPGHRALRPERENKILMFRYHHQILTSDVTWSTKRSNLTVSYLQFHAGTQPCLSLAAPT